jgi:hypothetical protein
MASLYNFVYNVRIWAKGSQGPMMTTVIPRWDALCDELDQAIEHWQKLYRSDAPTTEAAYRRVIDIGDDMTRLAIEQPFEAAARP